MEHAMRTDIRKPEKGADAPPNMHEADIGSGERPPGQHETDDMIRQIPPRGAGKGNQDAGKGNQQSTRDGKPSKG
jgi:hypothetical protein